MQRAAHFLLFTLVEYFVREFRYTSRPLNDFFLWLCIVLNRPDLLTHFFKNLARTEHVQRLRQFDRLVRALYKRHKLTGLMKNEFVFPFISSPGVVNARCLYARAIGDPQGIVDALSGAKFQDVPTLQMQLNVWAKIKLGMLDEAMSDLLSSIPNAGAADELAESIFIENICAYAKAREGSNEQLDAYVEQWIDRFFDKKLTRFSSKAFHRRYANAIAGVCHYYLIGRKPDRAQRVIRSVNPALLSEKSILSLLNFIRRADKGHALQEFCRDLYRAAPNNLRIKVAYVDELLSTGEYEEANQIVNALIVNSLDGGTLTKKQKSHVWFKFAQVYRKHGLHDLAVRHLIRYLELKSADEKLSKKDELIVLADLSGRNRAVTLEKLSKKDELIVLADLSGRNRAVTLDWDVIFNDLPTYDFATINYLLGAAFVRLDIPIFDRLYSYMVAQLRKAPPDTWQVKDVLPLITFLYKLGRQKQILELLESYSSDDNTLKMFTAFARNEPVEALHYRSLRYRDAFLLHFSGSSSSSGDPVLYPEKDLCGEVFSSFFYQAEFFERGPFFAICDDRLLSLYQRNFPHIRFIPKKAARRAAAGVQTIDDVPDRLRQFLDRAALARCEGAAFFSFNHISQFQTEACENNRKCGWVKPRADLQTFWRDKLSAGGARIHIAISANSTLSAPNRDVHMVPLEQWSAIFDLKDVAFINVNPAFDSLKCQELAEHHGIALINPDFDLYNDFENLVALLSVVDCAILPANSLMDFGAAVGVKTYVFSPTKIMRNWILPGTSSYVFSNNVQFVMADDDSFPAGEVLAAQLAQRIVSDFGLGRAPEGSTQS